MQEPLGILSIASVLRQAGHDVSLTDMTFADDLDDLAARLREAEVLGLGFSTSLFDNAVEVLRRAREVNPSLFAMAGGPQPTIDAEGTLNRGFDAVLVGEAERSVVELLRSVEQGDDWRTAAGVASLQQGQLLANPRTEYVADLDELPFVSRDLINQRGYFLRNGYISVFNTRGCPYKCRFCKPTQEKLFGKRPRARSPANVAEELLAIKRTYGSRTIYFKDDTLLLCGRAWFEELRRELDARKLKPRWFCLGRVDQINEPLLLSMKAAGLTAIAFGVESGSQRVLDFYQKGTTPAHSRDAFGLCQRMGILTHAYLMLGAPDETVEDLQKTVELFRDIMPHSYRVSIATPFPGTYLHEHATRLGISRVSCNEELDCMENLAVGRMPMQLEHLSREDIQRCASRIRRIWLRGNITRCLTDWQSMKAAMSNAVGAMNIGRQRL